MMLIDDYKNIFNIMLHPGDATKKAMGVGDGIVFFWKSAAIPFILQLIEVILFASLFTAALGPLMMAAGSSSSTGGVVSGLIAGATVVFVVLLFVIIVPIAMIIGAAIVYVIGKYLLGFKGDYANTFTGIVYGTAAVYALIWIPFVSIIGYLWGFIVEVIAVANQNKTDWVHSFVAIILLPVVLFIISIAAAAL
ncbi:MAG: hypothetical protein KGH72_03160 [Candidatus Micrarchaeota archaeon]|nr:hypothetical protein [Candidatus Micrarchaeota archaeon]